MGCAAWLVGLLIVLTIDFFFVAGVTALVCWAFGLTFTWPIVIAAYAVVNLLMWIFSRRSK